MAQSVKSLPHKHQNLSSIPRTHPGAHNCNQSAGEVETGRFLGLAGQSSLVTALQASEGQSQEEGGGSEEAVLSPPHPRVSTHLHTPPHHTATI